MPGLPYFLQQLLITLGLRPHQRRLLIVAEGLYQRIVDQARRPEFFRQGHVVDHRDGRLEVLWLHLFLLFERLRQEPATRADDDIARIGEFVAEVAARDLEQNLRHMGVGDMAIGRRVKKLSKKQYARLAMYRRLFAADGAEYIDDQGQVIPSVRMLVDYVYTDDHGQVSAQAEAGAAFLESYMRASLQSLARQPMEEVLVAPDFGTMAVDANNPKSAA